MSEATFRVRDGIKAVDPNVTGNFAWEGIRYLQDNVTVTFVNGDARILGGAWTPLTGALWLAATVVMRQALESHPATGAGNEPRQLPDAVRASAAIYPMSPLDRGAT